MSFRLWTIFYVLALAAAAMATFGPASGTIATILALSFWGWAFYLPKINGVSLFLLMCVVLVSFGLLLPALTNTHQVAERLQCMNNLQQIAAAVLDYHGQHKTFPPAYIADADGKPMHSWRVLILPFLGENAVYRKYDFSEPWDGPNNIKLASQIPDVYRCPRQPFNDSSQQFETHYFAIVGPETVWPEAGGRTMAHIANGTMNTLMLIEVTGNRINWMEPRDLTMDQAVEVLTTTPQSGHMYVTDQWLTRTYHETSYRHVAVCDGYVHWLPQLHDPSLAESLVSRTHTSGREVNYKWDPEFHPLLYRPDVTRKEVKWGKVWGLTVFGVLSLLPAAWLRWRSAQPLLTESHSAENSQ